MGFWRAERPRRPHAGCHLGRLPGWLLGVLAGLVFLGIGIWEGQFLVIWRKAVMICLECIGIG